MSRRLPRPCPPWTQGLCPLWLRSLRRHPHSSPGNWQDAQREADRGPGPRVCWRGTRHLCALSPVHLHLLHLPQMHRTQQQWPRPPPGLWPDPVAAQACRLCQVQGGGTLRGFSCLASHPAGSGGVSERLLPRSGQCPAACWTSLGLSTPWLRTWANPASWTLCRVEPLEGLWHRHVSPCALVTVLGSPGLWWPFLLAAQRRLQGPIHPGPGSSRPDLGRGERFLPGQHPALAGAALPPRQGGTVLQRLGAALPDTRLQLSPCHTTKYFSKGKNFKRVARCPS